KSPELSSGQGGRSGWEERWRGGTGSRRYNGANGIGLLVRPVSLGVEGCRSAPDRIRHLTDVVRTSGESEHGQPQQPERRGKQRIPPDGKWLGLPDHGRNYRERRWIDGGCQRVAIPALSSPRRRNLPKR